MATLNQFTAVGGERARRVVPQAVQIWTVPEGDKRTREQGGRLENIIMPGILISLVDATTDISAGLNCADDIPIRLTIQIVDNVVHQQSPIATYTTWMNAIRKMLLTVPNPFLQDAVPSEYDPYVVHVIKRISAEAQSLVRHDQQVAVFNFQVMVRQHR